MAIVNAENMTPAQLIQLVSQALVNHRQALNVLNELYKWTSGLSVADLTGAPIGMSATNANAILAAVADAHAEYLIHNTGQAPSTYPQVTGPYPYGASQTAVIGPS